MAPKRKATQEKEDAEDKRAKKPAVKQSKATKEEAKEDKASAKSGKGKAAKSSEKEKPETKAKGKKSNDAGASGGSKKQDNKVEHVTDAKDVPEGAKRDNRGRLVFEGFPDFRPTLTPRQVIQAGSFGGIYFNPKGGRKSTKYPDGVKIDAAEFPADWFKGLKDEQYKGTRYNIQLNRYKVKSGQNQSEWEDQGWIRDQDPRGWFQWYCRFVMGRRTDDDKRQISRWTGVAGPKGRWKTRLVNTVKGGSGDPDDGSISPVIRQNLLHWAYELTQEDYDALSKGQR